jgi:N-acetylmuramoyl-L-alanine amidase
MRCVARVVACGFGCVLALGAGAGSLQAAPKTVAAAPAPAMPAKVHRSGTIALDARLAGDTHKTRLVVDLSGKVAVSAFTTGDPYRVIVDLPNVSFDLPANSGRAGRGLVTAFRYGLIGPGKARIVLDATGPVKIDKAFVQPEFEDQPARLVVDLVKTDAASFKKTSEAAKPVETVATVASASPVREASIAPLPPREKPVVVIDPGHGGNDSGATGVHGENEKDIVLSVGKLLRDKLESTGRYTVVMTRTNDTFIPLNERVEIARKKKAALFISLHADFIPKREGDARGATVYTVSGRASDREAARLADKENKADLIGAPGLKKQSDDIVNILYDLTHRETQNFSSLFQRTLVGQLKSGGVMLHQDSMRSAGFVVLKAPDIPSVLLELGYVSNADDVKNLTSAAWQDNTALSIAASVDTFFAEHSAIAAMR